METPKDHRPLMAAQETNKDNKSSTGVKLQHLTLFICIDITVDNILI